MGTCDTTCIITKYPLSKRARTTSSQRCAVGGESDRRTRLALAWSLLSHCFLCLVVAAFL